MNERIKSIIEQNERILNLYTIGPVQRAEVEQFMQSIVQECINVVQKQDRIPEGFFCPKSANTHEFELRKHFEMNIQL
jgi:hypothetical protein